MLGSLVAAATCVKLLFLPSYKSTDFEVHRNWLAITASLPVGRWYTDSTSEWTLDYPPFFAWFEFLLSKVAALFDPEMLRVDNLNYSSERTLLFQRLSVIVTDLVFAAGARAVARSLRQLKGNLSSREEMVMLVLLMSNSGLFIVDHIHFQYNGFLFGVLLLSIGALLEGSCLAGGFWFAVLLNLKHIYLYVAPAYFVFLLRSYCFPQRLGDHSFRLRDLSLPRLVSLGLVVILTFCLSLGPFLHQLPQLLARLFPFKRGLCHAYWAPNFWAVYNLADKLLATVGRKTGLLQQLGDQTTAAMTGGLVQDIQHSVLPNVPPAATFALTLLGMLPALVKLWLTPYSGAQFLRCLTLCGWSSFLFGWHVHEKAILVVVIPLTILAVFSKEDARNFVLVSLTGNFSLLPLLFTSQELLTKAILHFFYSLLVIKLIKHLYKSSLVNKLEAAYLILSIGVFLYAECLHEQLGLQARFPFVPLLLYSLYAAIGLICTYVRMYRAFLYRTS